jgi:TolA-binding protein
VDIADRIALTTVKIRNRVNGTALFIRAVLVVSALCVGGASGFAQGTADLAKTLDAERSAALAELSSGRAALAIERLEKLIPATGAIPAGMERVAATLAIAYDRAGFRSAFIRTAERVIAAGAPAGEAAELNARLKVARAAQVDGVAGADLPAIVPDSDAVTTLSALAWSQYGRKAFDSAAANFAAAAGQAPSAMERWELRLMAAQARLEVTGFVQTSSTAGYQMPATSYQSVLDSAKALAASIDARVAAGAPAALANAAAARRTLGALWAGEATDGRLTIVEPSGALRPAKRAELNTLFTALGAPAQDPVARALAWTPGGSGTIAARLLADSVMEADALVARRTGRVAELKAARAGRIADAARYVATVRGFADTLNASAATLNTLRLEVAQRDSAINATLAAYRALIQSKINETRAVATHNRASADSLAPGARRAGELPTRVIEGELGAAEEYLAVAEAAASALERGLTRLDIVTRRDSAHRKFDLLNATMVQARANYDSSLAAALAAERTITTNVDREIAEEEQKLAAAVAELAAVSGRAGAAGAQMLASRVPVLKARLDSLVAGASYGLAHALFLAAIEVDTIRANANDVSSRRNSALTQFADAAGASQAGRSPGDPGLEMRAQLLLEYAELLTRKADADFAASQRSGVALERPDYSAAIVRLDELLRLFPADGRADAAAYTLGSLAFLSQKYDDAERAFAIVMAKEGSPYRAEAFFRSGDAQFEKAAKLAGEARKNGFAGAAASYDRTINLAPAQGDLYFLALYKLGWSNYMQAGQQDSDEYRRAVDIFARLVREVDQLPPERQSRLALRQEGIDYLAIAITQLGGPQEAVRYIGTISDLGTRMLVLRRVAHALRDQGEFTSAVIAFRGAMAQAPTHANVLESRQELIELFQSRMIEPAKAQEARLELIDSLTMESPWGRANAAREAELKTIREKTLREAGSYALTRARSLTPSGAAARPRGTAAGASGVTGASAQVVAVAVGVTPEAMAAFANAAQLFSRYMIEFATSDSAQRVSALEADARFGARDWFASGVAYSRTAVKYSADPALTAAARRNAVVAFDSALSTVSASLVRPAAAIAQAPGDSTPARKIQDSLITATERFTASATPDEARSALISLGRRMSEGARWDVVATTFARVADTWPADAIAPEARKFVGDAKYKLGKYAEAQVEWKKAQEAAQAKGRKPLVDSIVNVRVAAAAQAADSLSKLGNFTGAADSILTSISTDINDPARAADLLRNAIEVHLAADSTLRAGGLQLRADSSRLRAIAAIEVLAARYPAYQHTLTYNSLRAKLLSDAGKPAEAAAALAALADANIRMPGRADAMVRVAVLLDSIGKPVEAAAAYEKFVTAYPTDRRAADAQYNAAVILRDAKDYAGSARAFQTFTAKFPGEKRVGEAMSARISVLRLTSDTSGVTAELSRLCVRPAESLRALGASVAATCADRQGGREFAAGMAMWDRYVALKLEIPTMAKLTAAGVAAAQAPKQQLLRLMNGSFTRAIATGSPEWVAAGSFQSGLAQWHYGLFMRDPVLGPTISDAARESATTASGGLAQQYFDAAIKSWQALVDKATADKFDNAWVEKARAALKGEGIPPRTSGAP